MFFNNLLGIESKYGKPLYKSNFKASSLILITIELQQRQNMSLQHKAKIKNLEVPVQKQLAVYWQYYFKQAGANCWYAFIFNILNKKKSFYLQYLKQKRGNLIFDMLNKREVLWSLMLLLCTLSLNFASNFWAYHRLSNFSHVQHIVY